MQWLFYLKQLFFYEPEIEQALSFRRACAEFISASHPCTF